MESLSSIGTYDLSFGSADEYGFYAVEDKVHVHDLHATMLALLGIDRERLAYRDAGRDFRLTDVAGWVVRGALQELPALVLRHCGAAALGFPAYHLGDDWMGGCDRLGSVVSAIKVAAHAAWWQRLPAYAVEAIGQPCF